MAPEDRFSISRCFAPDAGDDASGSPVLRDFFRITLRHGYTDEVVTRDLGMLLYEQLRGFVIRECGGPRLQSTAITIPVSKPTSEDTISEDSPRSSSPSAPQDPQDLAKHLLSALDTAYAEQVVYVVGKEQMRIQPRGGAAGFLRRVALGAFLWLRGNTGSRVASLNVEVEKLVEVGFVKMV